MPDQYASFREKLPASAFTVTATNGGALTTTGMLNFYIQLVNRAGRNLLSEPHFVTYSAGQKIVLTINATAIASGEEVFYIIVSATTGSVGSAVQLARWVAREANQMTKRSLPVTIEFSRDAHLIRVGVVADLNSLPSGADLLPGMVREVTSEQTFYLYDGELREWVQYPQGFYTSISATTAAGGSDCPLNEVQGALRAPPLIDGGDSTPVRLWWLNGYGEAGASLPKGKRFNLRIAVDKSLIASNGLAYSEVFSGLVKISSPGYVRRSTGVLDTLPMQSQLIWSGYYTPLTLPLDLPPGYAVAWDIVMSFSADQLRGYLKEGSEIEVDLVEVPETGIPSPLHAIYGNVILNSSDYFYIVPNRRKKGKAIIGGYQVGSESEQVLVGLVANTANQQCVISGTFNGEISVRPQGETIFATEALRAVVSTETGMGNPTTPVSVTLQTTGAIEVVVTHPTHVRSDYPDEVAGVECQVNVPYLRVFVVTQTGILRRNDPVSVGTASTTILISELTVFTPIGSIVTIGNDFCLFAPTSVIATAKTTGSIAAGSYQVLVAYEYPSPNYIVTKVSHNIADGCIERLIPSGDMKKSVYDTDNDGKVDVAEIADAVLGIEGAGVRNYYGKNSSGQKGFFAIAADMLKSDYDTDNDGIVDSAEKIEGIESASNSTYYGKNSLGDVGFFVLPSGGTGEGGLGDMSMAVYDPNSNGIVNNSEALNGQSASFYLNRANHTGSQSLSSLSQSGAIANQVPQWNGTNWVPATIATPSNADIFNIANYASFQTISSDKTIALSDHGKIILCNASLDFLLPSASVINQNIQFIVRLTATGTITYTAGSGATRSPSSGSLSTVDKEVLCRFNSATNTWYLTGALS